MELFVSKCALNSSISFSKFIFPTVNSASNGFSITIRLLMAQRLHCYSNLSMQNEFYFEDHHTIIILL